MAVGPKRARLGQENAATTIKEDMGETTAIPWQDDPEDMDILSGVEGLPMWSAAPGQMDTSNLHAASLRSTPSLPGNFPTLSSREADALLNILPNRGADESGQVSLSPDIPEIFSIPSSIMRTPLSAPSAGDAPPTSAVYSDDALHPTSSARELSGDLVFPFMAEQEAMGLPLNYPIRGWDVAEERARRAQALQSARSSVSWHEPMPEIPSDEGVGPQRRSRLTSSAPQLPSRSFRTILQLPTQQEKGVPIRIRVPPLSERDGPPRASSTDTGVLGLCSPFDAPVSGFGTLPHTQPADIGPPTIGEHLQPLSRGSTPLPGSGSGSGSGSAKYRVRSNALPRKRSVSETRLTEYGEDAMQAHAMLRNSRSAEGKERLEKSSPTSSERGHKHSSGLDSEDSSGAVPGSKAEGRAAEAQPMVAIHPDKLARFLLQLQTIQAKVNSLQAERFATAQKAETIERGGSILSQLVDEMDQLGAGGASVEDREAQLKARISELKDVLAASNLTQQEGAALPSPPQATEALETGGLTPRDVSGPSTSSKDTDVPGPSEMNV